LFGKTKKLLLATKITQSHRYLLQLCGMIRLVVLTVTAFLAIAACSQQPGQGKSVAVENLSTTAFESRMKSTPSKIVLDVRTDEEFKSGHLQGAINMNVNDPAFADIINKLDTTQPVFVYCLAGGRSAKAADILKDMGFPAVYNMEGGMSRWTSENRMVESPAGSMNKGMKKVEFESLLAAAKDTLVLVDFWAKWCAPCKKIMAYMPDIEKANQGKLKVIKINYDDNTLLVKELGLDNVPYLFLYRNGKQLWKQSGYLEADALKLAITSKL
jgi:rhodanese-related sulfurtransferase